MKKFAIVIAGCGVYDGAEIHEATLSLWAIAKQGGSYEIFAPDKPQHHVINHLTGQEMPEKRNILIESARIARGHIKPITELKMSAFDAILFPGGFGVAKNLCNFAFEGKNMTVDKEIERVVLEAKMLGKPIGALCIAPVILAKLIPGANLTIGQDKGTATAIHEMGAEHIPSSHGEVIIDPVNLLFSTPCYMLDANILEIAQGAENIVSAMMKHLQEK